MPAHGLSQDNAFHLPTYPDFIVDAVVVRDMGRILVEDPPDPKRSV